MQINFTKEEKYRFELLTVKRNNLMLQDQLLQKEAEGLMAEFCRRNSVEVSKAKNINIEAGFVEFEEETGKEKTETTKE